MLAQCTVEKANGKIIRSASMNVYLYDFQGIEAATPFKVRCTGVQATTVACYEDQDKGEIMVFMRAKCRTF